MHFFLSAQCAHSILYFILSLLCPSNSHSVANFGEARQNSFGKGVVFRLDGKECGVGLAEQGYREQRNKNMPNAMTIMMILWSVIVTLAGSVCLHGALVKRTPQYLRLFFQAGTSSRKWKEPSPMEKGALFVVGLLFIALGVGIAFQVYRGN